MIFNCGETRSRKSIETTHPLEALEIKIWDGIQYIMQGELQHVTEFATSV
jgi:hypothetical protein